MGITEGLKRGTVELMLLTLLKDEDMYGYQLSQELEIRSKGLFLLQEGSMYPTLYRMLEKGLVSDRIEKVGKRRTRVYYHIEPKGGRIFKNYQEGILFFKPWCFKCSGNSKIGGIAR